VKKNQSCLAAILIGDLKEDVTPWAGAALLVKRHHNASQRGVGASAGRHCPRTNRQRGWEGQQMIWTYQFAVLTEWWTK